MTGELRFFVVAGKLRACPATLWDALLGPKPPDLWRGTDGCTCAPDNVGGYLVWPMCRIHDYHTSADRPDIPRILGDLTFRINVWRGLRAQGAPWWTAVTLATPYWIGVRIGALTFWRNPKRKAVAR